MRELRSRDSMNWMAPICRNVRGNRGQGDEIAYQGGEIVAGFSTQLLLMPKAHDVLDIGDQMLGIGLEDDIDQKRYEGVRRLIRLRIAEETKDDFAAIKYADHLVTRCSISFDLQQLLLCECEKTPPTITNWLDVKVFLGNPSIYSDFLGQDIISFHVLLMLASATGSWNSFGLPPLAATPSRWRRGRDGR